VTVIDDRQVVTCRPMRPLRPGPVRARSDRARTVRARAHRPGPTRPAVAPLHYRGTGVAASRAVHTRRPVGTATTVALAGLAALITLWLGSLAHFSGAAVAPAQVPDELAVVQVQAGETLQHLAGRVAPDAPAGQVMERIRDLNQLDSVSLDAGQTLIAPVG